MSLFTKLALLARSPQGRKAMNQAKRYAQSPEGRAKIDQVRRQIASRGTGAAQAPAALITRRHAEWRAPDRRAPRAGGRRGGFGLPGVHNLALWEALRESPIRLVGVRHEQAAAYAADGYARATGRLGVALTTTGPGRREHARRGRRGVGGALADPRDRDRHPRRACARRASTAACCTRRPTRPRCSRRS